MNYLHYEFNASAGSAIVVTLDKQANVRLLDSSNFANYRSGRRFSYHGGLATESPIWLHPPHAGHWHVVIDTGGVPAQIRASARLVQ